MIKLTDILNEDCWKGYKQIGMKTKGGKQVPNCVPESKEVSEYSGGSYEYNSSDPYAQYNGNEKKVNEASMTVSIANIVKDLFPKEFFQVYKKNDVERVKSAITDLVKTLNRYYKQHNINVRFVDSNIKMKMYAKESAREDLTSSERLELYKLYSKAMKAMPQSPNQKKIIKKINVLRTKAGMKPLKEVTLNEIGIFNIHSYTKGILPPGYMDTTTPQKKEKYRSTVRDLMQTLNSFWKRNNIPFRVRK
jgi:Tfp pilus assembly protein PilE